MDDAQFDQLIERARNPNLIAGIYNYCDRRCSRCAFTVRCFTYLESCRQESALGHDRPSVPRVIAGTLEQSLGMIQIIGRRLGVDLRTTSRELARSDKAVDWQLQRSATDPLVVRARDYTTTSWPILRALRPVVEIKGDAAVIESVETLEALCTSVSTKVYRAVCSTHDADFDAADVQSDANGSAKIARLVIDDSRRAWRGLMEVGRATADGVPARLVKRLDEIDAGVAARFPRAMEFIRPGFDTDPPAA